MTQSAFSTGRESTKGDMRAWTAMSMATILIVVCSVAAPAFAQCQYEVTAIIEAPPCGEFLSSPTVGRGMNNAGHVCGFYVPCGFGNDEAFYWTPEIGFVTLPRPTGVARAWANNISDTGLIVGNHEFTGIGIKGFVYDIKTGEFTHLEPLHDGVIATNLSSANAVNSSGVVAGSRSIFKPGEPNVYNAVIWDTNTGEVIDLGVMEGPNSAAMAISDCGMVAGWTGSSGISIGFYRDSAGQVTLIDPAKGADTSGTSSVDQSGIVVGTTVSMATPSSKAYLWHQNEGMKTIDPLHGFSSSQGRDINGVGQVLMRSSTSSQNIVATLWQHGMQTKLQDLLASGSDILLGHPVSITDTGQILVRVGNTRAGLLTPLDVPFADLNYDCNVDVYDLLLLLNQWGPVGIAATEKDTGIPNVDLNGDGVVNVLDLLILLQNFTL